MGGMHKIFMMGFVDFHYFCVKETTMTDIALELARLHVLKGADFVRQLKMLVQSGIFKPVENERDIFAADANHREDFPSLLDAARKAVAHGNKVYILPNPNGIRTADFIFENKGIYFAERDRREEEGLDDLVFVVTSGDKVVSKFTVSMDLYEQCLQKMWLDERFAERDTVKNVCYEWIDAKMKS